MSTTGLSLVVPVYNSAATLDALVERIGGVMASMGLPYELILVNDGSRDQSWDAIARLAAVHPWVRGINLMRNYGQHNALLCGIRAASYPVTVTLDDDLQNPPEAIPALLAALDAGADVVYGVPERETHGILRDLASQMTKLALQSVMGAETARSVSAYRAFRTVLRDAFKEYRSPFVSIDVLLTWGTKAFSAVKVPHVPRQQGTSNYTLGKLVAHAFNLMTGFSVLPLQMASWIGFAFTAFGFVVLLYVVGRYVIQGGSVPGFPFLASIIAIFSGAQLFALGIMGEYLARMHYRIMDRPAYAVKEST
jgi:undecaprenyl-phosphate 4-deoxy-4-formamido-L-arabinose transferase